MDAAFGTRHGTWDGSIAGLEHSRDGGGDALFVANDGEGVDYSPVASLARLPGSIHLLQFPGVKKLWEKINGQTRDRTTGLPNTGRAC